MAKRHEYILTTTALSLPLVLGGCAAAETVDAAVVSTYEEALTGEGHHISSTVYTDGTATVIYTNPDNSSAPTMEVDVACTNDDLIATNIQHNDMGFAARLGNRLLDVPITQASDVCIDNQIDPLRVQELGGAILTGIFETAEQYKAD